jgi:NAD(P) transhydrogenase subunit alpha
VPSLVVLREKTDGERRVALVPTDAARFSALGVSVLVEAGAGRPAGFSDEDFERAGAEIGDMPDAVSAVVYAKVRPPSLEDADRLPPKSILLSFLPPLAHTDVVARLRDRQVTALSFDLVPRISRAQSLDALTSQASTAGYKAAVLAADRLTRIMPMLMTAAGTVPPTKVLVLGAGVAGLQAIATAKRLGAAVSAYDVRPEAAEEIRSLGARVVELPIEAAQGSGGYAAEQSSEFLQRQQELVAATVGESDVVITTAAVPGRPAPKIVTEEMVTRMKAGSLIVDLAAASGGNCTLTRDGEEVQHSGVTIIGAGNLSSEVATSSSALYSRNVVNTVQLLLRDGDWTVDLDDEVFNSMCVVADGVVRHEETRIALEGGRF